MRKLQQQRELERAQETTRDDSDESEDMDRSVRQPAGARPNLFAALGGEDEDEDEDNQEEGEDAPVTESQQPIEPDVIAKSGKKKKKKSKKAKAASREEVQVHDEDEIDKAIKELEISAHGSGPNEGTGASEALGPRKRMNELLSINPYHLRAVNEMRNLFGREVIESADAEEQQEHGRRRRQQMPQQVDLETFLRAPPGSKKLPEVSLRRNIFVQGRDHWPRDSAGGLAMREIGKSADGLSTEYAYFHDKDYDAVQGLFWAFVQIGDPMRMVHLLKQVRKYTI